MSVVLQDGLYKIISITGKGIGVNLIKPALQPVVVEGPDNTFTLKSIISNDPGRTFDIGAGSYPYTGKVDDSVFATINEEQKSSWTVEYKPDKDAFTITLKDGTTAWSLPDIPDVAPGTPVTLEPVNASNLILPTQLFKFIPV